MRREVGAVHVRSPVTRILMRLGTEHYSVNADDPARGACKDCYEFFEAEDNCSPRHGSPCEIRMLCLRSENIHGRGSETEGPRRTIDDS